MPLGQKVVIVGGGHNGLIAAFYLAKGGFKPVVLERRDIVGGGAVTEEFHPGFFASTLAHTLGPLRADVARDLAVEKFDWCDRTRFGERRRKLHEICGGAGRSGGGLCATMHDYAPGD